MTSLTLGETAQALLASLRDYIEATYHISDERLVRLRRRLLEEPGIIHQQPFIESTPRYRAGDLFQDLPIPPEAIDLLLVASKATHDGNALVHNPPYEHQAAALVEVLGRGRSAVVTTGTGSGKTECFLLPILGHLARQASREPASFAIPAVRALLLYPMNALVNDQLGRLRLLLGHDDVANWFKKAGGRPARFARYTSRTLYPGIRTREKDQKNLRPIGTYYVDTARRAVGADASAEKRILLEELSRRGKWPAKPDLLGWYGAEGSRWQDSAGNFVRCVTQPDDPELLTRHEVLAAAPDVLITNYSMLEYMLMRPLERTLFDSTRAWLANHPAEPFLVVVDEAHLYRGSAGAEVGLLLRRLTSRLGLTADRLQVICTTASFAERQRAPEFAAKLSGVPQANVSLIGGTLALREESGAGSVEDAERLASIDIEDFFGGDDLHRSDMVGRLRSGVDTSSADPRVAAYEALRDFPPMGSAINLTMAEAQPVQELGPALFPTANPELARRAATTLVALGSYARAPDSLDGPGLLPSRLHAFFRGLPGLWVCLDPSCGELPLIDRGGPTGRLFGQPMDRCACGSRVFELFTCRSCGSAYCRAYADSLESPRFLWSTPGEEFASALGSIPALEPLDLLLESPVALTNVRPVQIDLITGRLNAAAAGERTRLIYLAPLKIGDPDSAGLFAPCAVCGQSASFGRSSVQDHQTEGDEPFQALVARQLEVQQPSTAPTPFAPMAGRKVLVFSDSRQVAARLAPNLQKFTTRDAVRPVLLCGFQRLAIDPLLASLVSLEDSYLAVLVGMSALSVRLRPATRLGDSFEDDVRRVGGFLSGDVKPDPAGWLQLLLDSRSQVPPESLLDAIHAVLNHPYYGLRSLALATVEAKKPDFVDHLPSLQADIATVADKRAFLSLWLSCWRGAWLHGTPQVWADDIIKPNSGLFRRRLSRVLDGGGRRVFERDWLPALLPEFTERVGALSRLRGSTVNLAIGGPWAYCQVCRTTQRPLPARPTLCVSCGQLAVLPIDPDQDAVFVARKAFFRRASVLAMSGAKQPVALVAAEHTAQLNDAQADAVFSEAEENELLFQDVDLGLGKPAIDVLSCTTTMEVGIDIGALSGVALRNMPPARANYQQRSGRAGRRGRSVATVTAYANSESHDEHGFNSPGELIRGPVVDPEMALDNWQIAQRHLRAYVLQEYLQARIDPDATPALVGTQLFAVLGTVGSFSTADTPLNRFDFEQWIIAEQGPLAIRARAWLPSELPGVADQAELERRVIETLEALNSALDVGDPSDQEGTKGPESILSELSPETEDASPDNPGSAETLLGRLLYRGVLPRYAFPTDVATFHVFDPQASRTYRPVFRYSPTQSMAAALSQYAPGKRVWIGNREWTSGSVYSRFPEDRNASWEMRRLYSECSVCHYAMTEEFLSGSRHAMRACPACGTADSLGPSQTWLKPVGFAHPWYLAENTSPKDSPPPSYATRARLTAPTPSDPSRWTDENDRISVHFDRMHLLVTNRGPKTDGYSYCVKCGLIESADLATSALGAPHQKPFPDERQPMCNGGATARGLVLGTDFLSDVLLISLRVDSPLTLQPGLESTQVALRTLSEALTLQAADMLGIGSSEIQAEFRPSLSPGGHAGLKAEIYLYDTLPGGAGYSQRIGELGLELFRRTLDLLESCPADCDASCYRCLRSYKNKFEHSQLDRHLGASLLRYLLTSRPLTASEARTMESARALADDLRGLGLEDLQIDLETGIEVPGFGRLIAPILASRRGHSPSVVLLDHPFAPGTPLAASWSEAVDLALSPPMIHVDELVVRRNLPFGTKSVLTSLGYVL